MEQLIRFLGSYPARMANSRNDDHGARREARQLLGDTAEEEPFKLPAPTPAHHNSIGVFTLGHLHKHVRWISSRNHCFDLRRAMIVGDCFRSRQDPLTDLLQSVALR